MDLAANAPTALVPAGGRGIIALVQAVLQHLLSPDLTAEERALLDRLKSASSEVGPYVLGAEDREDILARVDTLLDDPAYYQKVLPSLIGPRPFNNPVRTASDSAVLDLFPTVFGPFLGPAALPHLRDVQRSTGFFMQWLQAVASTVEHEDLVNVVDELAREPLAFVNSPLVPVPVARSLLAEFRNDVFVLSAFDSVFQRRTVEPWLGLALAELWAATMREALVLPASFNRDAVPLDIVPPEKCLDLEALKSAAMLVDLAYSRFNTDAEHSGEPVYPSVP